MADNFLDTAERMNNSSKTLHQSGQFHNACYCAGYVIECYLKLFGNLGLIANPRTHGHNINALNTELKYALSNAATSSAYRQYILNVTIECSSIVNNWHPNKRYEDNTTAWNAVMSSNFQTEKDKCIAMITRMKIDAVL